MWKSATLLVLAALSLAFAPAPLPQPDLSKGDLKRLQGDWALVYRAYEGRVDEVPPAYQIAVEGARMSIANDRWLCELTLTLDARKSPKAIDAKEARPGGVAYRGVYRIEGDTLTVCSVRVGEGPRPTALAGKGPKQWLEVFRRQKP